MVRSCVFCLLLEIIFLIVFNVDVAVVPDGS